jgi:hypothetical protein
MNNNIFIPSDTTNKHIVLTYTTVLDTIPKNHYKKSQPNLNSQNLTEWRWRILLLHDKKSVEISYMYDNVRMYLNNYGKWVQKTVPLEFDNYVVEEYYYYT